MIKGWLQNRQSCNKLSKAKKSPTLRYYNHHIKKQLHQTTQKGCEKQSQLNH